MVSAASESRHPLEESAYLDAVRNLSLEQIAHIESTPVMQGDSPHTAYCKQCFQALTERSGKRLR